MLFASALLATAAAVAPPRIELDLSAMSNAVALTTPDTSRPHDLGYTQPGGAAVTTRQDWSEICAAGTSTNENNCPFPSAAAYDHQDQVVSVTTRVKLVDLDGVAKDTLVNQVNFAERSTYLFRYDAHDAAGNRAEQVIFELMLDDKTPPAITVCGDAAETVEAASYEPDVNNAWQLCSGSTAIDNIDGGVSISYDIHHVNNGVTGSAIATSMDFATAVTKITTSTVGQFLVTLTACDAAGAYGTSGANNCHSEYKAIEVKDTRAPVINIHGADPLTHECATTYTDAHALVTDLLDTVTPPAAFLGQWTASPITVGATSTVNTAVTGAYTVKYNAADAATNAAAEQTREVQVTDTTIPVIALVGQGTVDHYASDAFTDQGATCSDSCDTTVNDNTITTTWSRPWIDTASANAGVTQLGSWTRTYECCDASNNCATAERIFVISDQTAPIISITGNSPITFEATRDTEYTDDGATCIDHVDGQLNHAVEVSGQVVNMRVPGVYVIRYDCQDLTGNAATPMNRTVVVEDTTCPVITLLGQPQIFIEAGFDYQDAGATATDTLDGDITSSIWTDGDQVETSEAFYSRRSCREIKEAYSSATDGVYKITTYISATSQFSRVQVWCDMTTGVGHTYHPIVCGSRVVPYQAGGAQGDCASVGLKMAVFTTAAGAGGDYDAAYNKFHDSSLPAHSMYFPSAGSTTDNYLCSTNDATDADLTSSASSGGASDLSLYPHAWKSRSNLIGHDSITRAERGKYIIFYHVSDQANNQECTTLTRTVTVRDTLPPVITLHLKNKLIHTSKHDQVGSNGQANPAGSADAGGNPFLHSTYANTGTNHGSGEVPNGPFPLMAEEAQGSSVNGWVIGAAASAVSGLALLASSLRKSDVTTVPV